MRIPLTLAVAALAATTTAAAQTSSPGHAACAQQFNKLSKGHVTFVPEVESNGDFREYYFAWNNGSKSKPIVTKSGTASGSCIIDRQSGKGSLTLNSKELGSFRVKAPL
jgi:hypothetical protein